MKYLLNKFNIIMHKEYGNWYYFNWSLLILDLRD